MIDTVIDIARRAGALAMQHWGRTAPIEKRDNSFVTEADRAVETFIRRELSERFPDITIVGEEHAPSGDLCAEQVWAIDPIDGTANFVAGLPIWAVCIGLLKNGVPSLGVVHFPTLDECFAAFAGQGACLNGVPTHARAQDGVRRDDLFGISSTSFWELDLRVPCKVRALGSAVAEFTCVAKGTFVGSVLTDFKLWDCVAGIVIAREAGAWVGDLHGCSFRAFDLPQDAGRTLEPMLVLSPAVGQEGQSFAKLKSADL